jgi:hypothetical protein
MTRSNGTSSRSEHTVREKRSPESTRLAARRHENTINKRGSVGHPPARTHGCASVHMNMGAIRKDSVNEIWSSRTEEHF